MNRLTVWAAAAAAALSPALAACGGGGGQTPTHAEYAKDANQRCAAYNRAVGRAAASLDASSSDADLARFLRVTIIPRTQRLVTQLEGLERPKGDEQRIAAIYAAVDSGLARLRALTTDAQLAAVAKSEQGPFVRANRLADAYGLKECAA